METRAGGELCVYSNRLLEMMRTLESTCKRKQLLRERFLTFPDSAVHCHAALGKLLSLHHSVSESMKQTG